MVHSVQRVLCCSMYHLPRANRLCALHHAVQLCRGLDASSLPARVSGAGACESRAHAGALSHAAL